MKNILAAIHNFHISLIHKFAHGNFLFLEDNSGGQVDTYSIFTNHTLVAAGHSALNFLCRCIWEALYKIHSVYINAYRFINLSWKVMYEYCAYYSAFKFCEAAWIFVYFACYLFFIFCMDWSFFCYFLWMTCWYLLDQFLLFFPKDVISTGRTNSLVCMHLDLPMCIRHISCAFSLWTFSIL